MKELNLSLKQLRYYLVAAKHSSLRKAARELRISQPSLSAQLKLLENCLGIVLFERNRGGVMLTPLGRELIGEATQAINAANSIVDAANFLVNGPSGVFRLGASPSLGPYSLPRILPVIHKKYTGVKFFVREDVPALLYEGLIAGNYDLIFTTLPIDDHSLTVSSLFREPIYLVVNREHSLAKGKTIKAEQLAGLEVLTIEEHHLFYTQVEALCKKFNAKLLRDYEGTSLDSIRQMVQMEMGVAFLPALYVRSEISSKDKLHILKIEEEAIYRDNVLCWRNTSPLKPFFRKLSVFFQDALIKEFKNEIQLL
ncbi:MAG: LysR family hydrogen peroxide-inducible transcriptional activator [Planctomycetota bacterium]|jgi:LysR family hydrogen peroxide-inducible transcriptional activator